MKFYTPVTILLVFLSIVVYAEIPIDEPYFEAPYIVKTDKGPVKGEKLLTVDLGISYTAFKGIPYAEPPTGFRRFKPPVEKKPWVYPIVSHDANLCIQADYKTQDIIGSEDCLYLNVFVPHTHMKGLREVMVWIHGGAYKTGNSNSSFYGPDFLLSEKVIVVSFNYRLGPLGFLSLGHPDALGNMGLKDQNLALKWVQRNIENFGGDPNKVTIFGQSAGSVSVDLHVLSDMSVGLFQKSISLSGSTLCLYWGFQNAETAQSAAFELASKLGATARNPEKILTVLHKASAADIISKAQDIFLSPIPFRPTIERSDIALDQPKFLTECALSKYYTGNFTKGPHLMGFTSTEALAFVENNHLDGLMIADAVMNPTKYAKHELPQLGPWEPIIKFAKDDKTENVNKPMQILSDLMFATGIDTKQRMLNNQNGGYPVYYYRFSYDHQHSAHKADGHNIEGVAHEDELPYIFHRPHLHIPLNLPEIKSMRRKVVRMLTNFAKYGEPTPVDDPILQGLKWPASGKEGRYLEISNEIVAKPIRPISTFVKFLEHLKITQFYYLNDCSDEVFGTVKTIIEGAAEAIEDIAELPIEVAETAVEQGSEILQESFMVARKGLEKVAVSIVQLF